MRRFGRRNAITCLLRVMYELQIGGINPCRYDLPE
jgi:hypothetical protein